MPEKLKVGKKKEESEEQVEKTIEDTENTWISKSKNGKAIFVTIPVDDLNKMEIQKYTNSDGATVEIAKILIKHYNKMTTESLIKELM